MRGITTRCVAWVGVAAAVLLAVWPGGGARAQDAKAAKSTFPEPAVEQAGIKAPVGFKVELFAAEPRVQNPSAFTIDNRGRFFVVEANRRKNGVLDLRNLPAWVEEDLA